MSNEFIPPNLYGNALDLYRAIVKEIQMGIPDYPHRANDLKNIVVPAIAIALQNKFVISLTYEQWKYDIEEANAVKNEQEFIDGLKNFDDEVNGYFYTKLREILNEEFHHIHQEKIKAKYAKFLQFFPEDEHEAVLTAIAYKGTYNNDDSQRNFFLNKMNFFRILPVNDDNMTWNMSSDEEFLIDEVNIFASVIEGVPHINEQETESRINGYEFTEDTIDDQLTGYLDWASERCGTDLARYKKWAWENQRDPLGLFPQVFPVK